MPGWVALLIRQEVAAALQRERAELADAIGKAIAAERKQNRTVTDALIHRLEQLEVERCGASDNDATVLDLRAERRRRSGGTG